MKRLVLHSMFLGLALAFTVACPGPTPTNPYPATCLPGQVCPNGLPAGATVQLYGPLSNVQDPQAFVLAQVINGNQTNSGINFSSGDLTIIGQGLQNGGTNYFVAFQIYPRPSNYYVNYCITSIPNRSCFSPIVITGNAAYSSNGTQHMLQLVYSPGIKLNIIVNSGTAENPFNGGQTSLTGVVINLVKNGQDPVFGGELLANASLSKYNYYGY